MRRVADRGGQFSLEDATWGKGSSRSSHETCAPAGVQLADTSDAERRAGLDVNHTTSWHGIDMYDGPHGKKKVRFRRELGMND